jgi:myo-inositol-hexaphosphate 3-phosphohydrolase
LINHTPNESPCHVDKKHPPKSRLIEIEKKSFKKKRKLKCDQIKINQDRVANNFFDLQNDFHEDQLNFPGYGLF